MKYVTHYKNNTYKFDDIDLAILCLIVGCSKTEDERKDFEFMPDLFKKLLAALRSNSQKEFQHAIRLLLAKLHPDKIRSVKTMQGMYNRVVNDNTVLKKHIAGNTGTNDNLDEIVSNFVATSITKSFNCMHSSYDFTYRLFGEKRDDINTTVKFLNEFLIEQCANHINQSPVHTATLSKEYSPQDIAAMENERIEKERQEKARVERENREKERIEKHRIEMERRARERMDKERLDACAAKEEKLKREAKESADFYYKILIAIGIFGVGAFAIYGLPHLASVYNISKHVNPNILTHANLASTAAASAIPDAGVAAAPILASNNLFEHIHAAAMYLKLQISSTGVAVTEYTYNTQLITNVVKYLGISLIAVVGIIEIALMPESVQALVMHAPFLLPIYFAVATPLLFGIVLEDLYRKITAKNDLPIDEIDGQKLLEVPPDLPENTITNGIPNSKNTNHADANNSGATTAQDVEAENRILAARNEAEKVRAMEEQRKINIQTINHIIPEAVGQSKLRVSI